MKRVSREDRFEFALRQIASYMTPGQLRRESERRLGLDYYEALEMAYENMQDEAKSVLRGIRKKRSTPAIF